MADLKAVYLAGRIERRAELNEYRRELEAGGVEVTSRWLANPSPAELTDAGLALARDGRSGGTWREPTPSSSSPTGAAAPAALATSSSAWRWH